ncbi:cupin domain-containing protein [Pseudorhodobacter ferrugineus]|uniref:cupin domain-containing protein n=1 Tax=Pseudorhodobacter ferrugineus TaxID=77008 RepID=UPI0003B508DA|nr:cupin domain-containing protein [Pseudorhodobacter ferrugineus]
MPETRAETRAEIRLPTNELRDDLPFYTKTLGMRLDMIYPADDPEVAVLSGHGLRIRIQKGAPEQPGTIRILTDTPNAFPARDMTAPNGTRVEIDDLNPPLVMPATQHAFVVRRLADQAPWVIGRAGMQYRDLVPSRLGGAIIASHIRIPDGGPVPDMVHFHKVGFQLIFCVKGWVDVVYEDQGEKIRLTAGDCFIQPPEIRHRVLEASDGIEVIEIGVPAEHVTEIDHHMQLPTPHLRPTREWQGQRFVHNIGAKSPFHPFRIPGFDARDTTINANTKGVASVMVARPNGQPAPPTTHDTDILFTYVMSGEMTLQGTGKDPYRLTTGDAFVIPPGFQTQYKDTTPDLQLLEVTLPGSFNTEIL